MPTRATALFKRIMADPGKIVEGVLAVNKPIGVSSAQVIRDLQRHFDPSKLFAPWLRHEARIQQQNNPRRGNYHRKKAKQASVKIGHGGTLDVAARGVLVTGIGKGTKELQKFLECTKTYDAVVLFGAATDSYDHVGKVIARKSYSHITQDLVKEALSGFKGKIMQRPPIFSALRVEGKRLYEYAREGKVPPVEIKERPVEVIDLEMVEWIESGTHEYRWPEEVAGEEEKLVADMLLKLDGASVGDTSETATSSDQHLSVDLKRKRDELDDELVTESGPESKRTREGSPALMSGALTGKADQDMKGDEATKPSVAEDPIVPESSPPAARIRMTVTSGFYVRSLCHDLGKAVGSLGIMADLVRTRQGQFELGQNVFEYDDLSKGEDVWGPEVEKMLDSWAAKDADTDP